MARKSKLGSSAGRQRAKPRKAVVPNKQGTKKTQSPPIQPSPQCADKLELPEQVEKIRRWKNFIRSHPLQALGVFTVLIAMAMGAAILLLWKDPVIKWVCTVVPICPGTVSEKENTVAVSTSLPRCWRGYLSFKLRDTPQSATWGPGTENLTICGNGEVSAASDKLLEKFAEKFSRCLIASGASGSAIIKLNYESGAVCRVPYVPASGDFTKSILEHGINVCVPEAAKTVKENGAAFIVEEFDNKKFQIYECDQSVVRPFGF